MNCRNSIVTYLHISSVVRNFFIILEEGKYNIMSSFTSMWPWIMIIFPYFFAIDIMSFKLVLFLYNVIYYSLCHAGTAYSWSKHMLHQTGTVDVKSKNIFTCLFCNICKKKYDGKNFSSFPLSKYHSACSTWTGTSDLMKL